jgi:hypothetical protein
MASKGIGEFANNETLTVDTTVFDDGTGDPYDLTDATTITFVIHDHQNGHNNVITVTNADAPLSGASGIDDANKADGILVIQVSADAMEDLCEKEYAWELHAAFSDGTAVNIGQGTINIYEGLV